MKFNEVILSLVNDELERLNGQGPRVCGDPAMHPWPKSFYRLADGEKFAHVRDGFYVLLSSYMLTPNHYHSVYSYEELQRNDSFGFSPAEKKDFAKQQFDLGIKVRWLHDFDDKEISCDEGRVIGVHYQYGGTPLERIWYKIRFDKTVFKAPVTGKVYELDVEAHNLVKVKKG